jgi:hypothetical protein
MANTLRYAVAAGYIGRCCPQTHVWLKFIRATDEAAAREAMRASLRREHMDEIAIVVLPVSESVRYRLHKQALERAEVPVDIEDFILTMKRGA